MFRRIELYAPTTTIITNHFLFVIYFFSIVFLLFFFCQTERGFSNKKIQKWFLLCMLIKMPPRFPFLQKKHNKDKTLCFFVSLLILSFFFLCFLSFVATVTAVLKWNFPFAILFFLFLLLLLVFFTFFSFLI